MFTTSKSHLRNERFELDQKWTGLWDILAQKISESALLRAWRARLAQWLRREAVLSFSLGSGQTMAFEGMSHFELRCESGDILVTSEGDGHDHVLRAGKALRMERPGLVVINAPREDARCEIRWP